jgi:hypothetical protein
VVHHPPEALEEAARNRTSVARRDSFGGTAPGQVRRMVRDQDRRRLELAGRLQGFRDRWAAADRDLQAACGRI